jgi:hypothetical protein
MRNKLLPFAGWEKLTPEEILEVGLPVRHPWEGFNVRWFGKRWTFWARLRFRAAPGVKPSSGPPTPPTGYDGEAA